ncbi:hypothetical protein [Mesobacillus zeae]|uniref:hypothetical protein n=1 Tax=Mesobacillus zeae TaxID=1917180 RepID=UPI0030091579
MPAIPMRQQITVNPSGGIDDWGNPIPAESFTLKCRIDEGAQVRQYRSAGTTNSEIVVATARILIDKLADISESDTITFTNELGQTIERMPKEINVKRDVAGKPMLTEVIV